MCYALPYHHYHQENLQLIVREFYKGISQNSNNAIDPSTIDYSSASFYDPDKIHEWCQFIFNYSQNASTIFYLSISALFFCLLFKRLRKGKLLIAIFALTIFSIIPANIIFPAPKMKFNNKLYIFNNNILREDLYNDKVFLCKDSFSCKECSYLGKTVFLDGHLSEGN